MFFFSSGFDIDFSTSENTQTISAVANRTHLIVDRTSQDDVWFGFALQNLENTQMQDAIAFIQDKDG